MAMSFFSCSDDKKDNPEPNQSQNLFELPVVWKFQMTNDDGEYVIGYLYYENSEKVTYIRLINSVHAIFPGTWYYENMGGAVIEDELYDNVTRVTNLLGQFAFQYAILEKYAGKMVVYSPGYGTFEMNKCPVSEIESYL